MRSFEFHLLLHLLAGALCAVVPELVIPWVIYIIFYEGTLRVFSTQNAFGQAHLAAGYMVAMEMLLRMSRVGLPHELTKYATAFILLNGVIARPVSRHGAGWFILFFVFQLPSLFLLSGAADLEEARQFASFNLSGPLCLAVAGFYFFRRSLPKEELVTLLRRMLLPIASTVAWLFIRTPRIADVEFSFAANFATSGYGPNQMASVLGGGIMIIGLAFLFQLRLFHRNIWGFVLLAMLAYRGLLTFSRGGMVAPVLVLGIMVGYFLLTDRFFRTQFVRITAVSIVLAIGAYISYNYANQQTGSALYNRYAGISFGKRVGIEKYASGRIEIVGTDFAIFRDHPFLGVGPGMGADLRKLYGYWERAVAHIEFSRLPAEHGLFGIAALLILIGLPLREFFLRKTIETRFLLLAGVLFCFAFMAHSATRIALPMYLYGLGFSWPIFQRQAKPGE